MIYREHGLLFRDPRNAVQDLNGLPPLPSERPIGQTCKADLTDIIRPALQDCITTLRLVFSITRIRMDNTTTDVLNDIECKQQYLDTCGNATYNVEFILLTSGLKRLMTELCNDTSQLREDYRQHRPCLENSTKDFESCFLRAAIAAARLKSQDDANGTGGSSENDAIVTLCRFQGIFRSCLVNVADEVCGKGTAKFLDRLLSLVLEDLYKAKCAHF
ncbi:hypothetical protein TNCV_3569461 [Trichonephila clavipes]|nr:hypothetical protein TNCV_3569461 [Trichonephila clavipes]